jgi:hypothetical protein
MRISQDLASGILLVVIGALGVFLIKDLPMGTMFRIGPALMPTAVSAIIVLIGLVVVARAWAIASPPLQAKAIKPVAMVLLAFTAFGLLIETAGLVVSSLVLILMGAFAAEKFTWKHSIVLAVLLTAFSVLLFKVMLKLPLQVWPQWN